VHFSFKKEQSDLFDLGLSNCSLTVFFIDVKITILLKIWSLDLGTCWPSANWITITNKEREHNQLQPIAAKITIIGTKDIVSTRL
jgi:hypothetical protein